MNALGDYPLVVTQIINSVIVALVIFVPFLVGKDARQTSLPWVETVAWSCVSLLLFPIGVGLYFWLGRNYRERTRE